MADPKRDRPEPESSPYGPHPRGADEASGGADSSPFETLPSGEKQPAAEEYREVREDRARPAQ